jgi:ethanolamine utilization microcompartment shell protein EutL
VRLRIPDPTALVAAPHLAVLAVLDAALVTAAHAVRAAVPDLDHAPFGCDPIDLQAARAVVDSCDVLLALVAELRDHTLDRQRRDRAQLRWPF